MFLSFEGIDGSGKSTQARLLASLLRERGREVVETREPGGTPLGEAIRDLLLDPSRTVAPRSELCLFSAARAQLVDHVIEPALRRGAIVIADRFTDSTIAYQGAGRSLQSVDWLTELNAFVTGGLEPHRTYLIDVDPSTAIARRHNSVEDRMEGAGRSFYERVRASYLSLSRSDPERILRLDGQQPVDAILEKIYNDVAALL